MFNIFKQKEIEEYSPPVKGDFVVVMHSWFVDSNGFKTFNLKGVTLQEAKNFGNQKVGEMLETFNKVAFTIVEFKDE